MSQSPSSSKTPIQWKCAWDETVVEQRETCPVCGHNWHESDARWRAGLAVFTKPGTKSSYESGQNLVIRHSEPKTQPRKKRRQPARASLNTAGESTRLASTPPRGYGRWVFFIIVGAILVVIIMAGMNANRADTIISNNTYYSTSTPYFQPLENANMVPNCYRWDQITANMAGQVVCVSGTIFKISDYKKGHVRFDFTDQSNRFFMISSVGNNFIWDSGAGGIAVGDCIMKTAEIQVNHGIPNIDIGNTLQSCQ